MTKDKKIHQEKLSWMIHEYDCGSLLELCELAKEDQELSQKLAECGVNFGTYIKLKK